MSMMMFIIYKAFLFNCSNVSLLIAAGKAPFVGFFTFDEDPSPRLEDELE